MTEEHDFYGRARITFWVNIGVKATDYPEASDSINDVAEECYLNHGDEVDIDSVSITVEEVVMLA